MLISAHPRVVATSSAIRWMISSRSRLAVIRWANFWRRTNSAILKPGVSGAGRLRRSNSVRGLVATTKPPDLAVQWNYSKRFQKSGFRFSFCSIGFRLPESFDFFQALNNSLLHSLAGGMVIGAITQAIGKRLHGGDFAFYVVGVLIVLAVAKAFHQARGSVAKMQRDRFGRGALDVFLNSTVGGIKRIRFWRDAQIDNCLRQREITFGHADEIHCIASGHTESESPRFGESDVFHRHAHDATRDVKRIFAGFEHAREPVESGVGVAIAD